MKPNLNFLNHWHRSAISSDLSPIQHQLNTFILSYSHFPTINKQTKTHFQSFVILHLTNNNASHWCRLRSQSKLFTHSLKNPHIFSFNFLTSSSFFPAVANSVLLLHRVSDCVNYKLVPAFSLSFFISNACVFFRKNVQMFRLFDLNFWTLIRDYKFADVANLDHCAKYLNQSLVTFGFPASLDLFSNDPVRFCFFCFCCNVGVAWLINYYFFWWFGVGFHCEDLQLHILFVAAEAAWCGVSRVC